MDQADKAQLGATGRARQGQMQGKIAAGGGLLARRGLLATGGLGLLSLAGCGGGGMTAADFALPCPEPTLLPDAGDLVLFTPGAPQDLANTIMRARIVGFNGTCRKGKKNLSLDMTVKVNFTADRGPASAPGVNTTALPWFVGVADQSGTILDKRDYLQSITWANNTTQATAQSQEVKLSLPVTDGRRPENYRILIGFQLTPAQLQYNRQQAGR